MYENIKKGLDRIDNPLIRQTVEYLISGIENADTDETYDIAKSSLLLYLNAAAPNLLRSDIAVDHALNKSMDQLYPDVSSEDSNEDYEKRLKKILSKNGIYYFGPVRKHNTEYGRPGDPRAPGDKRHPGAASDPHEETGGKQRLPSQTMPNLSHGQRPGKREMISFLRDFQRLTGVEIGSRNELKTWSHDKLKNFMQDNFPDFIENYMRGSGRKNEAATGFGYRNTIESDRLKMLSQYLQSPSAPRSIKGTPVGEVLGRLKARQSQVKGPKPAAPGAPKGGSVLPEVVRTISDIPRDNILYQNIQRLRPDIKNKLERILRDRGLSAPNLNRLVNDAIKDPNKVVPKRSTGNPDMPKWMTPEAAADPRVEVDRAQQERYAEAFGYDLPPTPEQEAESAAQAAEAERIARRKKGYRYRTGGGRSITGGDMLQALEAAGGGFSINSSRDPFVQDARKIASEFRRQGMDKQKALDIVSNLAHNMDLVLDHLNQSIVLDKDELKAAQGAVTSLLGQIRDLGYRDLASYFKDKLNIGETVSAVFENAPRAKMSKAITINKFYSRLEKYRTCE